MSTNNVTVAKVLSLINSDNAYVGRAIVALLMSEFPLGDEDRKSVIYFSKWVLMQPKFARIVNIKCEASVLLASRGKGRAITGKHLIRAREIASSYAGIVAGVEYDATNARNARERAEVDTAWARFDAACALDAHNFDDAMPATQRRA